MSTLSLNDRVLAERAREARRALGDRFLTSPRVVLGAICDFCPEQPEQIAVLQRCLDAPWAQGFLTALAQNTPAPLDDAAPHESLWCRGLLAYACETTDEVPLFAAQAPVISPSTPSVAKRSGSGPMPIYAAVGAVVVVIAVLLLANRGASRPPIPVEKPPQAAVAPALVPDVPPHIVVPSAPASDYPPEIDRSTGSPDVERSSPSHPRTRSRPTPLPGSEPSPPRQRQHAESKPPKHPELRQREKPPEENGE